MDVRQRSKIRSSDKKAVVARVFKGTVEMQAGIEIRKIWSDEELVELSIRAGDGVSQFICNVYAGHQYLKDIVVELEEFREQIHGGIHDLRFGEFGQEYAAGAFHARLHFQARGRIHVSVLAQSEFFAFGNDKVAHEIKLYLMTEPSQLDEFVRSMRALSAAELDEVTLNVLAGREWGR